MTKNPIYNALAATGYIVLIVFLMNILSSLVPTMSEYIAPVIMLSLFTFSAGIMAYIFGYYPFLMFMDGDKEKAVSLFLKTLLFFGGIIMLTVSSYLLFI